MTDIENQPKEKKENKRRTRATQSTENHDRSQSRADLEEEVSDLKRELAIEKDLILKKQREWTDLIETLNPTIEALGNKIKTLQNDLHLKNQELTDILQSLSSGLIVTDLNGVIRTFNKAAVAITGIESERAIGQDINQLFQWSIIPEFESEDAHQQIRQGFHQEFIYTRKDQTEVTIDSNTTLMESDESEKQRILINLNDISQLKKFQEEAERKNRLIAMGEIAMQVAHEIRNPLGSIELFLSMMKMDLSEDSHEIELVQHIGEATKSMNHIISNLLEYTKPRPVVLSKLNAHDLLDDFIDFIRFSAEQQNIDIQLALDAERTEIKGNTDLLKQVFHNLFVNACQSMPEGGYFTIKTDNYEEKDAVIIERFQSVLMTEKKSLPVFMIQFEDTGKGMTDC